MIATSLSYARKYPGIGYLKRTFKQNASPAAASITSVTRRSNRELKLEGTFATDIFPINSRAFLRDSSDKNILLVNVLKNTGTVMFVEVLKHTLREIEISAIDDILPYNIVPEFKIRGKEIKNNEGTVIAESYNEDANFTFICGTGENKDTVVQVVNLDSSNAITSVTVTWSLDGVHWLTFPNDVSLANISAGSSDGFFLSHHVGIMYVNLEVDSGNAEYAIFTS